MVSLHVHASFSDGTSTFEQNVAAAARARRRPADLLALGTKGDGFVWSRRGAKRTRPLWSGYFMMTSLLSSASFLSSSSSTSVSRRAVWLVSGEASRRPRIVAARLSSVSPMSPGCTFVMRTPLPGAVWRVVDAVEEAATRAGVARRARRVHAHEQRVGIACEPIACSLVQRFCTLRRLPACNNATATLVACNNATATQASCRKCTKRAGARRHRPCVRSTCRSVSRRGRPA